MLTLFESYLRGYKALYHFTSVYNAMEIMQSKVFQLSVSVGTGSERSTSESHIRSGKFYYLSTSRSPMNDYSKGHSAGVFFILRADIIEQRVKSIPVDYWGSGWNKDEMEERLISDKPTIPANAKTIDSIHILLRPDVIDRMSSHARKLVIAATKLGIETFIYNDPRHFYTLNHRKALTGEEKRAFISGQSPTNVKGAWGSKRKNWMAKWVEVYTAKSENHLSNDGKRVLRYLKYYPHDFITQLEADIHNNSRNHQETLEPLLAIWKKHRISTAKEYLDILEKKWRIS